jgi:hypothetical protein
MHLDSDKKRRNKNSKLAHSSLYHGGPVETVQLDTKEILGLAVLQIFTHPINSLKSIPSITVNPRFVHVDTANCVPKPCPHDRINS